MDLMTRCPDWCHLDHSEEVRRNQASHDLDPDTWPLALHRAVVGSVEVTDAVLEVVLEADDDSETTIVFDAPESFYTTAQTLELTRLLTEAVRISAQ